MAENESNVTKSPTEAPCEESNTETVVVPLVVKGLVRESGPDRMGVMSLNTPPTKT